MDKLEKQNLHERDEHISFDEVRIFIRLTERRLHVRHYGTTATAKFNADVVITNMMNGKNWSQSKYYGMSREEIKAQWETNRDEAAQAGTKTLRY